MTKHSRHPWKSPYEDWRDPRPCAHCLAMFTPLHHRTPAQRFCGKRCAAQWRIAQAGDVVMRGFVAVKP